MRELFENGHLTEHALQAFASGAIPDEQLPEVAEHIGRCPPCAERMAQSFENETLRPPAGFKEELLRKREERKTGGRLLFFSLRVAVAACFALFLLFSSTLGAMAQSRSPGAKVSAPSFAFVQSLSSNLSNFSQKMIHWEAFSYEKEKK